MDSYRFVGHKSGLKKIRFVSWITNPDLKRFGSYRDHESSQFSKESTCFHKSNESSRILSTMARNKSLKIKIREFKSLRILKLRIRKSGFANPNLKDSYRGFVSEKKNSQITRFVSFRKDSYTNPASIVKTHGSNPGTDKQDGCKRWYYHKGKTKIKVFQWVNGANQIIF
jgi:hypothetical protein